MGLSRGVWRLRPQRGVPPLHPVLSLVTDTQKLHSDLAPFAGARCTPAKGAGFSGAVRR